MDRKKFAYIVLSAFFIVFSANQYVYCSEKDGDAYNNQAAYSSLNGKYEDAVSFAEKAIVAYPNKGIYHSTLATAYYKMDNLDEAISAFTKAIDLGYQEAEVYSVLGNAYFKKDMLDEAIAAYRRALEIESIP